MLYYFDRIPLTFFIATLFLGLAPFFPEPHVWEKLKMLADGSLSRSIDIFDLVFHSMPWILLTLKLLRLATKKSDKSSD